MFITIRNLPISVKTNDINKLITEKCLIADVILGHMTREEGSPTRKITIGLADECDAAIVFRKLNGLYMHGNPLILEDSRKNKRPLPGELPQLMNAMPYQATALHMQTQERMTPSNFFNPMDHQSGFGFVQQPMMMSNQKAMLDRNEINQPRHQINQRHYQVNQPRYQMNQPKHQMNQPRHHLNQPRPQINKPLHQFNQPPPQNDQMRHQMHQPRNQHPSCYKDAGRNRQESNQRIHEQGSSPPYEESLNDYEIPQYQEPYNNTAVEHQTALDWDIPSRELLIQETDPVWNTKVKKYSDMTSNDFQLENRQTKIWDEPHLANQMYADNFEQFAIDPQDRDIKEDDYSYHKPSTNTEAYHPNDDDSFINDNYTNPYPNNENQEYNVDAMPFDRPKNPAWEPRQQNDNFEINNRKRPYSTTHDNYHYSDAATGYYGQHNRNKRNKTDNYNNSYASIDMGRHQESPMKRDFSYTYNESEIDNEFEQVATDGSHLLGFKKFKFSYKLSVPKFKEFEHYMFKNLISTRFTADVKAYNVMYAVCRLIMKKLSSHLEFNFRKYAYFVLNYIQLLIEKALDEHMYDPKTWKHKSLFNAFHQNYTYPEFFLMFKKWFEYYDHNCDLRVTPKIAAMLNEAQIAMATARPNLNLVPPRKLASKPVYKEKPDFRFIRAQREYNQARTEVRPAAQKRSWAYPNAPEKHKLKKIASYTKQKAPAQTYVPGQKRNEERDLQKTADKKAMEMVRKRVDTILKTPIETTKLVQVLLKQLDPELERALHLEMEGINKEVFSCINIPEKITLKCIRRSYLANFKRSLIYRLFNVRLAMTAKVTFAPGDKQPKLAACNKFFNARDGKVLHIEQNMALVLFSSNEMLKKMCDEKDVEVEGCKIQNVLPLDFDINTDEFHTAIENAIKTDNIEKVHDLIFNKSYIKGRLTNRAAIVMSDTEENTISEKFSKSEPNFDSQTTKPNSNSGDKKPKSASDAVQNSKAQMQEKLNIQTAPILDSQIKEISKIKTKPTSNTKTDQTSNIKTDQTSNIKTNQTSNIKNVQTSNIKNDQTSNTITDEKQNIQFDEKSSNEAQSGPPSPLDGDDDNDASDRDEKIKIFLDDFEKAINADEEIFMCEDDLEDFEL